AIIAPIALRFADRHGISPLLMGLMVIHGAQGGGFSPISIYGGITNQIVERAGLPRNDLALFLASFFFNLFIAVLIFIYLGRHRTSCNTSAGAETQAHAEDDKDEHQQNQLNLHRSLTLGGLIVLAVGSFVFELNVGLVAISVAVLLALLAPGAQKKA